MQTPHLQLCAQDRGGGFGGQGSQVLGFGGRSFHVLEFGVPGLACTGQDRMTVANAMHGDWVSRWKPPLAIMSCNVAS